MVQAGSDDEQKLPKEFLDLHQSLTARQITFSSSVVFYLVAKLVISKSSRQLSYVVNLFLF